MSYVFSVWVLEIGVYHATQNRISRWEIWSAHNTRDEAIVARDKSGAGIPWRIRKYVPVKQ